MATITIFGASSRQGQAQVTAALHARYRVRAVTRNAAIFAARENLEVVAADYLDPPSLDRACAGADIVFFQRPQMASPRALDRGVGNVAAAAKQAGVRLAIYNSTMWAPDTPCGEPAYDHVLALEDRFLDEGPPAIVFRPVLFMDNIATLLAKPKLVQKGVYRFCHRPGLLANWISLKDVAAFMVAAIERPDLVGRRLLLGGPERLAIEEVLAILGEAIGRPIRHEFVEPRAFSFELAGMLDIPTGPALDAYADFFDSFYSFNNYSPHRPFEVDDMAEILTLLPVRLTTFREWAAAEDWSVGSLARQRETIGSASG